MSKAQPQGMDGIERDAQSFGILKRWNAENNRIEWRVDCRCGTWDARPFTTNTSPQLMMRRWKQHGWTFTHGEPPTCTDCRNILKGSTPVAQIGPDMKLARQIMSKLSETFSEVTHRYLEPWSDAEVANSVGCTAEIVAHIRVDAGYGEIVKDPETLALQSELDTLKDAVGGELAGLREEFKATASSLVDKFKNEMTTLRVQTDNDITAALQIFNDKHAELTARLSPLLRKAS